MKCVEGTRNEKMLEMVPSEFVWYVFAGVLLTTIYNN